jgi:catechol 2,3-dioxygenase-like lactoylglutathione lyase family enzyme
MPKTALEMSHLILHVADTKATIDFWCAGLGGEVEQDEELEAASLDAIFGREGVRIRDTFIRIGGIRLHTIETLDERRAPKPPPSEPRPLGLGGVSFHVPDLDAAHARAEAEGREPTPIYAFTEIDPPVRMFFLNDPDGVRVEMIEEGS